MVLALVALAVSACGVRGSLELTPEQKAVQAERTKNDADGKRVHEPFILDGLLR